MGERVPVDTTEAAPRVQERAPAERSSYAPAVAEEAAQVIYQPFGPKMQVLVVIRQPERVYRLRGTLIIELRQEDGEICAYHRRLPIVGYGLDAGEAINDFAEMFDAQYRGLVECDEGELSEGALQARRHFEALVEDVHPR